MVFGTGTFYTKRLLKHVPQWFWGFVMCCFFNKAYLRVPFDIIKQYKVILLYHCWNHVVFSFIVVKDAASHSTNYSLPHPPPHPKQNKTWLEIACLFVTTEWARLHLKKIYWGNKVLMFLAWDQVRQWSSMYFIALTALSKWSGPSWAKEYCTISCFLCSLALAWGKWHWQAWM